MTIHPDDLVRSDFEEEGQYQWVAHRQGYRIVVRAYNGHGAVEVIVRPELEVHPTPENWQHALKLVNEFYHALRVAQEVEKQRVFLNPLHHYDSRLHDLGARVDDSMVDLD